MPPNLTAEFNLWDSIDGNRELVPESCPLPSVPTSQINKCKIMMMMIVLNEKKKTNRKQKANGRPKMTISVITNVLCTAGKRQEMAG